MSAGRRIGVAHHLGWAIAVSVDAAGAVVDRRRLELLDAGLPAAPVHHEGGPWPQHRTGPELSDTELAELVARVRAAARAATARALDELVADVGPVEALAVRAGPELPADVAVLRRAPWESRADSVMYCEVLAEAAGARGWAVHRYDPKALALPSDRPPGPPWTKDHRLALAAARATP